MSTPLPEKAHELLSDATLRMPRDHRDVGVMYRCSCGVWTGFDADGTRRRALLQDWWLHVRGLRPAIGIYSSEYEGRAA